MGNPRKKNYRPYPARKVPIVFEPSRRFDVPVLNEPKQKYNSKDLLKYLGNWIDFTTPWGNQKGIVEDVKGSSVLIKMPKASGETFLQKAGQQMEAKTGDAQTRRRGNKGGGRTVGAHRRLQGGNRVSSFPSEGDVPSLFGQWNPLDIQLTGGGPGCYPWWIRGPWCWCWFPIIFIFFCIPWFCW